MANLTAPTSDRVVCPHCGHENNIRRHECQKCRRLLNRPKSPNELKKQLNWVAILGTSILILFSWMAAILLASFDVDLIIAVMVGETLLCILIIIFLRERQFNWVGAIAAAALLFLGWLVAGLWAGLSGSDGGVFWFLFGVTPIFIPLPPLVFLLVGYFRTFKKEMVSD